MKASELRGKTAAELKDELLGLRKEEFNLRMQKATGTAKLSEFKRVRRDIARVKTVINEQAQSGGNS